MPLGDVLSPHAPGGPATQRWLNARWIGMLPSGAVVVNTGRGTLVDDPAPVAALRSGRVSAAGLDVYDGEPRISADLLGLESVVLLPHLGNARVETQDAMGMKVLDGIDREMHIKH